ncbi:MAG: TVP38/TMEM64 family protein [Longimicrobiales bacterium]|nr:TVP38/TMEM64 family protein [Longimicrobiales bacterium]
MVRGLLLAAAAVAALVVLGRWAGDALPGLLDWIEANRRWAMLTYVAVYAVAAVAWVPGSLLTVSSGVLFGPVRGTAFTLVGATLGASFAFLIARHLARAAIERRLGANERLAAVDRAIAREGWKVVFLIRLSPVFPFNLLNYALGLTRVRFWHYVSASALGMIPGTFLYVYSGWAAGRVATGAVGADGRGALEYALLGVGLLATVLVTWVVTRTARRALAAEGADGKQATGDPATGDQISATSATTSTSAGPS